MKKVTFIGFGRSTMNFQVGNHLVIVKNDGRNFSIKKVPTSKNHRGLTISGKVHAKNNGPFVGILWHGNTVVYADNQDMFTRLHQERKDLDIFGFKYKLG